MKRIISCLLILVLMAAAIPASAAEKPARLVLDAPYAMVGEELAVDIRMEGLNDCAIFGLVLEYDPAELKVTDFVEGKNGGSMISQELEKGQYSVVWMDETVENPINGDVVFGTLKFEVIKAVNAVALKVKKVEAATISEELVEINYVEPTIPLYNNHPFVDVKNEWFKESVLFVYNNDLMNGMGENKFKPNEKTTRAMLVTILYRNEGEPAAIAASPFADLKQNWYKNAVNWAFEKQVVEGMSDTTFAPDDTVTREQIATMMYRYAKSKGVDVSQKKELNSFPDEKKVSKWAKEAMEWANAAGLITGNSINGKVLLDPQGAATRAQIATILMRYVKMTAGK